MLSACATDHASKSELTELAASVRAIRAENARLEAKLEKLEQQVTATSARPQSAPAISPAAPTPARAAPVDALPPLTVVKLKPRKDAAPAINTAVPVVEPSADVIDDLPPPAERGADEAQVNAADQQYERALDLLKTGSPEQGISSLLQFTSDSPRHPRADNALYFAGMGMMALKDFEGAEKVFARVSSSYPAGDVVLDSQLKQAECLQRLGRARDARALLERVVTNAPGSAAAAQAQNRLASVSATPAVPSP